MFALFVNLECLAKAILLMLCLGSAFLFTTDHFNSNRESMEQTLHINDWIYGILSCHCSITVLTDEIQTVSLI